jgi:uncharacterized phiE125 gp8 family phage protein
MPYTLVTAPTEFPVTIQDLKDQACIDGSDLDARLDGFIAAATTAIEKHLDRALITQTRKEYFPGWPCDAFVLMGVPLVSVTHVKYYSTADVSATLASTSYDVDVCSEPGLIRLKYMQQWPTTTLRPTNPIEIQYVCGYGSAASVPEPIKQAILMLAASWVRNREADASTEYRLLDTYTAILSPFRVIS